MLNFDEDLRVREFQREVRNYWELKSERKSPLMLWISEPRPESGRLYFYRSNKRGSIILGLCKDELINWIRNSGNNPGEKEVSYGYYLWIEEAFTPSKFPERGTEIFSLYKSHGVGDFECNPGEDIPVIFSGENINGTFVVGGLLRSPNKNDLVKGFRHISKVPQFKIVNEFSAQRFIRCKTFRGDEKWIHGRENKPIIKSISNRKIGIVGCGSIGSGVVKLLVQEGLSNIILIDSDVLLPHNTTSHILGQESVWLDKTDAIEKELRLNFPHINKIRSFSKKFCDLSSDELQTLSDCDVIVTAGIDYEGESQLSEWRLRLERPPIHVSLWIEAHAVAGHVVVIMGQQDTIQTGFEGEDFKFRVTEGWPDSSFPVEAGCGNSFQPHSYIDSSFVISLGAKAVIDVLMMRKIQSYRQVWLGDKNKVEELGGELLDGFTDSFSVKEFDWNS